MDPSTSLPLHPDLRHRCGPGTPLLLSELADPQQGPSRCHALAADLRRGEPEAPVSGGVLYAFVRWLDALIQVADALVPPESSDRILATLGQDLGPKEWTRLQALVAGKVPGFVPAAPGTAGPAAVASGSRPAPDGAGLVPLTALLLTVLNPAAAAPASWLGLDRLAGNPDVDRVFSSLRQALTTVEAPDGRGSVFDLLELPARHAPHRLDEQLLIAADSWRPWLGDAADDCARAAGVIREESRPRFDGPGETHVYEAPVFAAQDAPTDEAAAGPEAAAVGGDPEAEVERFSSDRDWMPRLILLAKNTHVWLHQLSRRYGRDITRLDGIPDEELDAMASRGITGLWLIGLWQRSAASKEIKRRNGNPEALSSAYAVDDYRIADDLGGDAALDDLGRRALERGIRLCGDMVPNHTGIDARWVLERPDLFLSLDHSPYPGYTFDGPDLSPDARVAIQLEDHYWEKTDAAVVFKRTDRSSGETRYIYHGNDGTSMPWNDTAQLDFLNPETREAVIGTILAVAKRFPVIRFDAAMVLARRHLRRLWHPAPGHDSDIPTRASRALSPEEFDRALPAEFWREVVDRVAAEAPDTLLLAEAFWMMEGYFVRTLGMHRVYNSAFMHMLRDQDNFKFRQGLKNVLNHDPRVLKRFVNFMSNPDEETAVEQFGTGDKYFGIATLMATLPGLPLLGHGQLEGFAEKYGMEYARAYRDEEPDTGFMEHHDRMISPLFHRRDVFAGADAFRLFDVRDGGGKVLDEMIAFANRHGDEAGLVIVNNCHETRRGRLHMSWSEDPADGRHLGDVLGLDPDRGGSVRLRDPRTGFELDVAADEFRDRGLEIELPPYGAVVFLEWNTEARSG